MTIHETGHIRNMLNQNGPVEQPHYADAGYQAGEYIEGGFEVKEKPDKPVHETIHMGLAVTYINDDMTPHYMRPENQPTERTEVIHVGNRVRYVMEDDETEADRKAKRAEAIAKAVELAVKNGDIDPDVFS